MCKVNRNWIVIKVVNKMERKGRKEDKIEIKALRSDRNRMNLKVIRDRWILKIVQLLQNNKKTNLKEKNQEDNSTLRKHKNNWILISTFNRFQ
jgi:hypothetical protein